MGAALSVSSNYSSQVQESSLGQTIEQTCQATCSQIQSGQSVIIEGGTVADISFTQKCTATASCAMTAALDSVFDSVMNAKQNGTASPSLFPGVQMNVTANSTNQEVRTAVKQTIESLCKTTVDQQQTNQIVMAKNATVGNIAFTQEGNANANCVMKNCAQAKANLAQSSDQTASAGGFGSIPWTIIAIIAGAIIGIGVITMVTKKKKGGDGGAIMIPS